MVSSRPAAGFNGAFYSLAAAAVTATDLPSGERVYFLNQLIM